MRNVYPAWLYALIVVVVLGAGLYALPNLFPEDPSVQIGNPVTGEVDANIRELMGTILGAQGVTPKQMEQQEGGQVLLRFDTTDEQARAADILRNALDDNHTVALNLAPATPNWLRAINGQPMSLGLDLRGGCTSCSRSTWMPSLVLRWSAMPTSCAAGSATSASPSIPSREAPAT